MFQITSHSHENELDSLSDKLHYKNPQSVAFIIIQLITIIKIKTLYSDIRYTYLTLLHCYIYIHVYII